MNKSKKNQTPSSWKTTLRHNAMVSHRRNGYDDGGDANHQNIQEKQKKHKNETLMDLLQLRERGKESVLL